MCSHIAPPDMNSYIKKYEFISRWPMNSYIRHNVWIHMYPILIWYINKMATDRGGEGGGWSDCDNCVLILVPGSNPHLDTNVLANLANFHVAAILAISFINVISEGWHIITYPIFDHVDLFPNHHDGDGGPCQERCPRVWIADGMTDNNDQQNGNKREWDQGVMHWNYWRNLGLGGLCLEKKKKPGVCVLTWSLGGEGRLSNVWTIESPNSPPPPRHLITKLNRNTPIGAYMRHFYKWALC